MARNRKIGLWRANNIGDLMQSAIEFLLNNPDLLDDPVRRRGHLDHMRLVARRWGALRKDQGDD